MIRRVFSRGGEAGPLAALLSSFESNHLAELREFVTANRASPSLPDYVHEMASWTGTAFSRARRDGAEDVDITDEGVPKLLTGLIATAIQLERDERAAVFDRRYHGYTRAPRHNGLYIGGPRHILAKPHLFPNLESYTRDVAPNPQEPELIQAGYDKYYNYPPLGIALRALDRLVSHQVNAEHDLFEIAVERRREFAAVHPFLSRIR